MTDWLATQAQQASPFVAVFCLIGLGIAGLVIKALWNQLLFERQQHRTAEQAFTESSQANAVAHEALTGAVDQLSDAVAQLTTMLNGVVPTLVQIAADRARRR